LSSADILRTREGGQFFAILCGRLLRTAPYSALFLKGHKAHFCSKFKNKLRIIPISAEEQSLKFPIKVVNKIAVNATQFAKCILLHAYSRTTSTSQAQLHENKQNSITYLSSWHKGIFGYKLRTDYEQLRLKILQKLTGSLNSEFTGSYKKKCRSEHCK